MDSTGSAPTRSVLALLLAHRPLRAGGSIRNRGENDCGVDMCGQAAVAGGHRVDSPFGGESMQKRLLWHPGQHRRHRGGMRRCHHLVGAARRRRRRRGAPTAPRSSGERGGAGSGRRRARRARSTPPGSFTSPSAPRTPTRSTRQQGVDQHRHRRAPRPRPRPALSSTRTSTSCRRWRPSHADRLGRRHDLHVHAPRREVQQRRPDRRR